VKALSNEVEIVVKVTDKSASGYASAKRGAKELEQKGGSSLTKFGEKASAVGLIAGAALIKLGSNAISAASDAQQSLGGTQAVFGKYADQIIDKSKGAAQAVGISANSYRESANEIGSLFKNQGVAASDLAKKTEPLIKLGADLSATYGGTAKDAVEALTAAYKGEFDPLEKYGISLKAATVSQSAYALAGVKTSTAFSRLTSAQQAHYKQLATTQLLVKQSASAQGQFADQTNTVAEKLQIVKAKFTDLSAELGAQLLPVVAKVLDKGSALLSWLEKNPGVAKAAAVAVGILAAGFIALGVAMLANPVSLIVMGIAALVAILITAYQRSNTFRSIVISVFKAVGNIVLGSVHAIITVFGALFSVMGHLPGKAGAAFRSAAAAAKSANAKVEALQRSLNGLHSRKVNVSVTTTFYQKGKGPGTYGQGLGVIAPGHAHGGIVGVSKYGTAASGGIRNGLTLVGERGAELVDLAPGTNVHSNGDSKRIADQSSGSAWNGSDQHIYIHLDGSGLLKNIRGAIRGQGGNVQVVLGS
jgi:hypothetical protein